MWRRVCGTKFLAQILKAGRGSGTLFSSPDPVPWGLYTLPEGPPAVWAKSLKNVGCSPSILVSHSFLGWQSGVQGAARRGARPHFIIANVETTWAPTGRKPGATVVPLWVRRDSTWTFNVVFPENFSLKKNGCDKSWEVRGTRLHAQ